MLFLVLSQHSHRPLTILSKIKQSLKDVINSGRFKVLDVIRLSIKINYDRKFIWIKRNAETGCLDVNFQKVSTQ